MSELREQLDVDEMGCNRHVDGIQVCNEVKCIKIIVCFYYS